MKRYLLLAAIVTIGIVSVIAEPPTLDLVFREDFGGNDLNDPQISTTPMSKISSDFTQITSSSYPGMAEMCYYIAKSGYCYGDTSMNGGYSKWYIQNDHTYPTDYNRGYFLEIDGKKGNQTIYETKVIGLDEGNRYFFSAWIANVYTTYQRDLKVGEGTTIVDPNLLFIVYGADTDTILATYYTLNIPLEDELIGADDWKQSSAWMQYGCEFELPVGMNAVRLTISNNVGKSGEGNDFAIDDIELRLLPQDTIPIIPPDTTSHDTVPVVNPDTILPHPITGDTVLLSNLIINKYNWILLCNNAAIAEYTGISSDSLNLTYQWFNNNDIITSATNGFYTEDQELNGTYRVEAYMGSKVFMSPTISHTPNKEEPVSEIMIYDINGCLVFNGSPDEVVSLRPGVYIRKEMPSGNTTKLTIQ